MTISYFETEEELDEAFEDEMDKLQEEARLNAAIEEAEQRVEDAKKALGEAEDELEDATREVVRAEEELKDAEQDLDDLREQLEAPRSA